MVAVGQRLGEGSGPRGVRWREASAITAAAAALIAGLHLLPSRERLTPIDFLAGGADARQFCDPSNPRFLAVLARPAPATLSLVSSGSPKAGAPARPVFALRTASGRPIGAEDLLSAGSGTLPVQLVGPSPGDRQSAIARPGARRGEWTFSFVPHRIGPYRVVADFTPAATARELRVSAELPVAPAGAAPPP